MPGFVLDTCILSEIRTSDGHASVKAAVDRLADGDIFVSVISLGELRKGAGLLAPGRRRAELEAWIQDLETGLGLQLLPIDGSTARIWGERTAVAARVGRQVGAADGLIAASALAHGLGVMTRNVRDFEPMGVAILDPWNATGI